MDDIYVIDTHAHLDMIKEQTPDEVVDEATKSGVKKIINVSTNMESSKKSLEFADKFSNVFAAVGVHPNDADTFFSNEARIIEDLIESRISQSDKNDKKNNKRVVAVGETGFDFFRNPVSKDDQERAFNLQIEIAIKNNLPVIIHDRDAHKETLKVIKKYSNEKNFKAVMHCFSADINFAVKCLEEGLFISFTGVVTFPNALSTKEAVKIIPLDRMFIETDCPFLAPQPKRGKENKPSYVVYVADEIARLKELPVDEVKKETTKNAEKFFNLNFKPIDKPAI
jgi:TatD DNase family protein